jgi:hypothetical protein
MNRTLVHSKVLSLALAGLGGFLFVAAAATAAEYPRLTARHAGSGTYEIRGGGGTWELADARVVLDDQGRASIAVSGRKIQLAMSGRIVGWNGREHVDIELDTFDGKATTAKGWIALDRRGGFERIEFDGQTPVRLGVSFRSKGANLEPPPPPAQPATPPPGLTEEPNVDRRGADYRHFTAEGLRLCQESCKGDTRCRAYSYNLNSRTCYLKSQVPGATSDREVISGVKEGWTGGAAGGDAGDAGGGSRLSEERGLDRRGNDYSDFRVRDLLECQESCLRDERCRAYSYDTIDRVCWLKDRVNSQERNRDMVTGYKE